MKQNKKDGDLRQRQTQLTRFLLKRNLVKQKTELKEKQQRQDDKSRQKKQLKYVGFPQSNSNQSNRSHTESLDSLSAQITPISKQKQVEKPQLKQKNIFTNVQFYLNKMPSKPNGEYIDKIHAEWYNNYQRLERDHSFIQWIFPNSFQSRFNSYAKPLSQIQAEQFKKNPKILTRYIKSYHMMLGFYGMRIKNKQTGQLARSRNPHFKERFYKTFLTSFHNHMRITRILCSLTQLGFIGYANQLCKFLKYQIESPDGQLRNLMKYNVYKQWKPFQNGVLSEKNTNIYMININKLKKNSPQHVLHIEKELQKQQQKK